MAVTDLTQKLITAQRAKGLTFEELAKAIGRGEVWTAALMFGQATASVEEAVALADALGLPAETLHELTIPPQRAGQMPAIPTEPLVYRLYEMIQVYGLPLKAIINEKFGDGIMSAIDFNMSVEKEPNPAGDRVKITMSGKFLPYKKW